LHCNYAAEGFGDGRDAGVVNKNLATAKFHDALMKHQEAAEKHLHLTKEDNNYSSDDDDGDDADDDEKDVFGTLVKSFNLPSGAILVIFFRNYSVKESENCKLCRFCLIFCHCDTRSH